MLAYCFLFPLMGRAFVFVLLSGTVKLIFSIILFCVARTFCVIRAKGSPAVIIRFLRVFPIVSFLVFSSFFTPCKIADRQLNKEHFAIHELKMRDFKRLSSAVTSLLLCVGQWCTCIINYIIKVSGKLKKQQVGDNSGSRKTYTLYHGWGVSYNLLNFIGRWIDFTFRFTDRLHVAQFDRGKQGEHVLFVFNFLVRKGNYAFSIPTFLVANCGSYGIAVKPTKMESVCLVLFSR